MSIFKNFDHHRKVLLPTLRWKTRSALLLWLCVGVLGFALSNAWLIVAFFALFPLALLLLVFAFFRVYAPVGAHSGRYVVDVHWEREGEDGVNVR